MVLAAVPMGARFRVKAVRPNGPVAFRMMEMGLIEGAEGRLLGRAPFGDPLQLRL
ncbi:MAG: FeoA domain-containing protein, partial [Planctomycetota bacterium]